MKWTALYFWRGILYDARQIEVPHRKKRSPRKATHHKPRRTSKKKEPTA